MVSQTKQLLSEMTPGKALEMLKTGNQRFVENRKAGRNLLEQTRQTSKGQFPFAVILGCIDSRVPPELVFDLGIGDVFTTRIAGNLVNADILGGMEFACRVVGSKHILVLGHTDCGAIRGARDGVVLGNLTGLVNKLQPAVEAVKQGSGQRQHLDIDRIAEINVHLAIEQIIGQSPVLRGMLEKKKIGISGAMYDVATGAVHFL